MNKLTYTVGLLTMGAVCFMAAPVRAYFVPINSKFENFVPNLELMVESEVTRWKQEALKYKEMIYTETLGRRGTGNDGKPGLRQVPGVESEENEILVETREAAGEGAGIISETMAEVDVEHNMMVKAEQGTRYSEDELKNIYETQGNALNDIAVNGITMGALQTASAAIDAAQSDPERRAEEIAKATELGAMYELILGMDRRVYERSLRVSAADASNASIKAMRILQGLSLGATGQDAEE